MKQETRRNGQGRRDFLRLAGLGAAVGTAALVTSPETVRAAAGDARRGTGYRVTEHVKKVYDLARF